MSSPHLDGATIALINYRTGTCIDLPDGSGNSQPLLGVRFQNLESQMWKVQLVDNGTVWPTWRLRNVKFDRYADLRGGGSSNGTTVQAWDNAATNNQLWRLVSADPFGRVFMIQNVGTGTYFDLDSGDSADGTKIQGWAGSVESQNPHQLWRILRIN